MLTDSNQTSGPPVHDLDDAAGVDQRDRQRDRHVHAEPARGEERQRAGEERRSRVEHDRRRGEQRQPAEQVARRDVRVVERAEPQRARVHHRLHRAEAGDGEPLQRIARLAAAGVVQRRRGRAAAHGSRRGPARRRSARSDDAAPSYTMRARCAAALTPTSATPGSAHERALDQPAARGAAHAVDQHDRLAPAVGALRTRWRASSGRAIAAALLARLGEVGRARRPCRCATGSSRRAPSSPIHSADRAASVAAHRVRRRRRRAPAADRPAAARRSASSRSSASRGGRSMSSGPPSRGSRPGRPASRRDATPARSSRCRRRATRRRSPRRARRSAAGTTRPASRAAFTSLRGATAGRDRE